MPAGRDKEIKTKWVLNRKLKSPGNVTRNNERLFAKGFRQKFGVYYDYVFELVGRYTSLRFLLVLEVLRKYRILQLKFKSWFLNGTLVEELYV